MNRYSPLKYTKSTRQRHQANSPSKNPRLQSNKYFAHYSNSIYMGGADCFKKKGKGILLMDNGSCILCSHINDIMNDHNVVFEDGSMTSIIVYPEASTGMRNKDICFRTKEYLIQFKQNAYNQIQGIGYFVDYFQQKVFQFSFQRSILKRKIRVLDQKIIKAVFKQDNLSVIIQKKHADSLSMKFNHLLSQEITHIRMGQDHIFGFCNNSRARDPSFQGLVFRLKVIQSPQKDFNVIIGQRGYHQKSKMNYFGQQHFENGNYYIGGMLDGKFHHQGVLVSSRQNKWTYGIYNKGELIEVKDSQVHSQKSLSTILKQIHQRNQSYIQNVIKITPNSTTISKLLEMIRQADPYESNSINYTQQKIKFQQNLKKVQHDYTQSRYQTGTQLAIKQLLNNNHKMKNLNPQKFQIQKSPSHQQGYKPQSRVYAKQYVDRQKNSRSSSQENQQYKYYQYPEESKNFRLSSKRPMINTSTEFQRVTYNNSSPNYKNSRMKSPYSKSPTRRYAGVKNMQTQTLLDNLRRQYTNKYRQSAIQPDTYQRSYNRSRSNRKVQTSPKKQAPVFTRTRESELNNIYKTAQKQQQYDRLLQNRLIDTIIKQHSNDNFVQYSRCRRDLDINRALNTMERISEEKKRSLSHQKPAILHHGSFKYDIDDDQEERDSQFFRRKYAKY